MGYKDTVHVVTLEDLVEYVVKHSNDISKYDLRVRFKSESDNVEAGQAWGTRWSEFIGGELYSAYWYGSRADRTPELLAQLTAEESALNDTKPSEHKVVTYMLNEKGDSRYRQLITLSERLGEQVEGIWTKVPMFRGSSHTMNAPQGLTLVGILKRLGKTDVKTTIEAEKARQLLVAEKNRQNNARNEVRRHATEILAIFAAYPEINFPLGITELSVTKLED